MMTGDGYDKLPLFMAAAPFSDDDTSMEAARQIRPHLERLEAIVYHVIAGAGAAGICDFEVEQRTRLLHQTASSRRRALVLKGMVEDSGERRRTPSGRMAKAWRATRQ